MIFEMLKRAARFMGLCLVAGWVIGGCANYTIPGRDGGKSGSNSCEECHTDLERLIAVHTPDTSSGLNYYGIDIPHYEPYDRVFLGGDGYDAFKESGHYALGCTGCHNGDGDSDEKDVAHSGDFIKHPSDYYDEKCSACHQEITDNFATSLHNGTGMKRKVAMRSGLSGPEDFSQLPAHQIEGYNNNCATCHGTCGNCHIVRPEMGGGGLSMGHNFNKTPGMDDVCIICHVGGSGHDYLGIAEETQPDIHLTEMDFKCLDCHDGHELHGDGQPVEQRYAYSELPKCEDCHQGIEKENLYHNIHYGDFDCHICHSQQYNNCSGCHINGDGGAVSSYLDFKIALNPLPDLRDGNKFALVRRTPAAPENWIEYGVEEYGDFDVHPTYNYATPHSLQRWTTRTSGDGCNSNCHISISDGDTLNKELYLWKSDLLEWELNATSHIAVDDNLPSSWTK